MTFGEPRLLALLALAPVAAVVAALVARSRARSEAAWAGRTLLPRLRSGGAPRPAWTIALLLAFAVAGLAGALARPRWGMAEQRVERRGVDVVFVIDSSLSMIATDISPSRWWLAQSLVRRMVAAMPGNRVALVAAEGVGVVLSPLTTDAAVIDLLLDAAEPASLPVPGSRIGPALERAIELFPPGSETHRAIVLLSDGEFHGEPLDGTLARLTEAGVTLHAIGVGTRSGAPLALGREGAIKRDARGQVVISHLDSTTLERLASESGGSYLHAADPATDPAPVLEAIDRMPTVLHDSRQYEALEERFQWPLGLAVMALGLLLAFGSPAAPRRRTRSEAT